MLQRCRQHWHLKQACCQHLCGPSACRGVQATLCYDRPPPHFRPTALQDAHELLVRLRPALAAPLHPHDCIAAMYQAPEDGLEVGA